MLHGPVTSSGAGTSLFNLLRYEMRLPDIEISAAQTAQPSWRLFAAAMMTSASMFFIHLCTEYQCIRHERVNNLWVSLRQGVDGSHCSEIDDGIHIATYIRRICISDSSFLVC